MHGQVPAGSTPGDQGAQGMGWHPCHGESGSLVSASRAGTGQGPWSLLSRSGHTGPTAHMGRQRTPASSKVTRVHVQQRFALAPPPRPAPPPVHTPRKVEATAWLPAPGTQFDGGGHMETREPGEGRKGGENPGGIRLTWGLRNPQQCSLIQRWGKLSCCPGQ